MKDTTLTEKACPDVHMAFLMLYVTHFMPYLFSIPPKNIRKTDVS